MTIVCVSSLPFLPRDALPMSVRLSESVCLKREVPFLYRLGYFESNYNLHHN